MKEPTDQKLKKSNPKLVLSADDLAPKQLRANHQSGTNPEPDFRQDDSDIKSVIQSKAAKVPMIGFNACDRETYAPFLDSLLLDKHDQFSESDGGYSQNSSLENIYGLPSRFESIELIGEGGMASVFKATDSESIEAFIAIKILKPELARDPIVVERFQREAKIAQKLSHPNLVRILDCGKTNLGAPYLIMEYVDGIDLSKIIKAEGHLSVNRNLAIFGQLCDVLKHAHKVGLVHRDIKPSNILVTQLEDGTEQVKLVDFGIAKPPRSERHMDPALTRTGSILGSPAYMSPEQAMGDSVDERSDIYSLGCVMYESLTGRNPFADDTPVKSILKHIEHEPEPFEIEFKERSVPKWLEEIVLKCLAKKPADRFQRMYLLEDALTTLPAPGIYRRLLSNLLDTAIVITGLNFLTTYIKQYLPADAFFLAIYVFITLYFVIGESSRMQTTLGKLAFGLRTYDSNGIRPDPLSVAAYISTVISTFTILVLLTAAAAFICDIQIYDIGVLITASILISSLLNILPIGFSQGRQDLFDTMFRRKIAKPHSLASVRNKGPAGRSNQIQKFVINSTCIAMTLIVLCCPLYLLFRLTSGPVTCVVPFADCPAGKTLTKKDVIIFHWLPRIHSDGAICDPNKVIGHRLTRPIGAGHEFTAKNFEESNDSLQSPATLLVPD